MPTGQKVYSCGLKETLEVASTSVGPLEKERLEKDSRKVGRGVACIIMGCGLFGSGSNLIANDDGTYSLITGVIDAGQGSATTLTQIAAEELGVSIADISYIGGDTDISPWDFGTVGSRITRTTGEAVRRAAADLKRQLLELAGARLETRVEDLEISDKNVNVKGSPDKRISMQELSLAHIWEKGGSIIGRGSFFDKGGSIIKEQVAGYPARGRPSFQTCTIIAEVEVDTETGIVHVLKCTGIQDVGKCINPLALEGQIEGGIVMGVGYALTEGLQYKAGEVENPNLVDYKIPTALDVPDIRLILIEEPDPTGPFGAKGAGEACLVPVAPAIANAIYDAIGVRIKELPITPEKVLKALKELNK
jgi:CO/xanthine dehydrogenase Mo-binding subunit